MTIGTKTYRLTPSMVLRDLRRMADAYESVSSGKGASFAFDATGAAATMKAAALLIEEAERKAFSGREEVWVDEIVSGAIDGKRRMPFLFGVEATKLGRQELLALAVILCDGTSNYGSKELP